jgi:hypothetical protein
MTKTEILRPRTGERIERREGAIHSEGSGQGGTDIPFRPLPCIPREYGASVKFECDAQV